jgi:branched-chain amino acid transport system substrate-binding protein
MVTQLKALNVSVPILVMTHCDSARFAETLAEASEYAFCAGQWHASLNFKDEWFGSTADFAALYKQTFGEEAPDQATQSAAAVPRIRRAFARAQSLEAAKVREAAGQGRSARPFSAASNSTSTRNIAKPMALSPRYQKKARARRPRTPSPHTACWPF